MEVPSTIYSDDEIENETFSDEDNEIEHVPSSIVKNTKKPKNKKKEAAKPKGFSLQFEDTNNTDVYRAAQKSVTKQEESDSEVDDEEEGGIDNVRVMPRAVERSIRANEKREKKEKKNAASGSGDIQTAYEMDEATEKAFFDTVVADNVPGVASEVTMFSQLNLSRPLIRGVENAGYVTPTPIQAKVIPLALAGRDVCASAVTGSGKTAAFLLPVLQRLLYRPRENAAIRVLVITPTRELATQIYSVLQKLAMHTDITAALICGGKKDLRTQEAMLRQRPDVVIGTPGRVIDHLRNSPSVNIDDLDVLILDEVDRLLDLGFQAELEELVRFCPESRQTLLFSATMTSRVEDLVKLSLKRPVRVKTAGNVITVAPRLVQEFIKLRDDSEREAMLASLVARHFSERCIVFFETKREAHRFYIILKLLEVPACELHGDLTQTSRDLALERFRSRDADVMVCTDVAARGLDIPQVMTVINAEMPRQSSTYVHRVGRTARAGNKGRAVTIVSDGRRRIMKEILKSEDCLKLSVEKPQVLTRTIANAVVESFVTKIADMESQITDKMMEERQLRRLEEMENDATKAENLLRFDDEIQARPKRTWYQSESEKAAAKVQARQRAHDESEIAKFGRKMDHNKDENDENDENKGNGKKVTNSKIEQLEKMMKTGVFDLDKRPKKEHTLSRTKRRRMEALAADEEGDATGGGDEDGEEHPDSEVKRDPSVKQVAKRVKVAKRETQKVADSLTVSEITSKSDKKLQKKLEKKKNADGSDSALPMKIRRPIAAIGGLDADMREWGMLKSSDTASRKQAKKLNQELKEIKESQERSNKYSLKKHSKPANKSFKSNKRYKRR